MRYNDVVIGAGHNGLTAAAYLARTGRSVLLLERNAEPGGATVSARPFPGVDARLSRYAYLVSLLPRRIMTDLDLDIQLVRRRYSSYTPLPANPARGLLIDTADDKATAAALREVAGDLDAGEWFRFADTMADIARRVFPTLIEPLCSAEEMAELVADAGPDAQATWALLTSRPLAELLETRFVNDTVRGLLATDGLIGTFADLADPGLAQNICFLYHLIGGGTGDWDVPVGGMGAVTEALAQAAGEAGATLRTGCEVTHIDPHDGTVTYRDAEGTERTVVGEQLYGACAPAVLNTLLDEPIDTDDRPRGSQLKINMLLHRLPRLRGEMDPEVAFAGTLHVNEGYEQLRHAYRSAEAGRLPDLPPAEVYCHTLSDRSILGEGTDGMHTLTLFGLHLPPELFATPGQTEEAVGRTLASLDSVLAEPIRDCLARDADGELCLEVVTPQDLEESLNLPGGNIFHRPLQWPWAEHADEVGGWGATTRHPRLLLAGAGARRGGGVSGIAGHNAAAAVVGVS